MVWGKDKPRVHHLDGKFAFRFIDLVDDVASVYSMSGQQPYTDEFFFWTPDLPKLLIKQAHIIKNYLSNTNVQQLPFVSNRKTGLSYRTIGDQQYWLSIPGTSHLVYPNWVEGPVVCHKPSTIVLSVRDGWFYDISDTHLAKRNLNEGLAKLQQEVPDYWKNDPTDFLKGIKGCWSRSYFLEK